MSLEKKIVIAIVPEQCKEIVLEAITSSDVTRVMSFDAKGTAEISLLQKLGLGQTKKTLIAYLQNEKSFACKAVQDAMCAQNEHTGILFKIFLEKDNLSEKSDNLLVCVIVNAGYAESVMQEARKAGARGGTIINARGTGKEQDMDFFGIQIVPEKEMLVMVAQKDLAEVLVKTVKDMPLLKSPGSGLVFTVEADSVSRLGGSST